MKKAICYFLTAIMLMATVILPTERFDAVEVAATVTPAKSTVNVGETLKVTLKVPDDVYGTVALYFPTDFFDFSGASTDVNVTGGTIKISMGKYGLAQSSTVTVDLKAKAAGAATLKFEALDSYNESDEFAMFSKTTTVTIANKSTEEKKSDDNSLVSLKLSSGTLSPEFKGNVIKYTAKVDYSVTSVVVSATKSSSKATIVSVTGNGNVPLNVGENKIEVVVRAENGTQVTYQVIVTRLAESESSGEAKPNPDTPDTSVLNDIFKWNNEQYKLPASIPENIIPKDFTQTSIMIKNIEVPCLDFKDGKLTVFCLENPNKANSLFVYDKEQKSIFPLIKLASEKSYVYVMVPNETKAPAPEGTQACTISIEGKGIIYAYRFVEQTQKTSKGLFGTETFYAAESKLNDYYLIYCMNSAGELGWYLYDSVEGTVMRYCAELLQAGVVETAPPLATTLPEQLLNIEPATLVLMIIILAAVAFVMLIVLVVLIVLLFKKNSNKEEDEFGDEPEFFFDGDDDYDYEAKVVEEPVEEVKQEVVEEIPTTSADEQKEEIVAELKSVVGEKKPKFGKKSKASVDESDDDIEFINF